ncbi:hypothetical protein LTR09_007389 [Extremus antarcticus]|uniref:Uncharacterized protein n=1 Tax=Extremus antarcticus TaxID=702011 RepID=A0AAJ0DCD3_9PEZI|nr:hypothetical protein LTR09_007389 [Extremus antarcticus]
MPSVVEATSLQAVTELAANPPQYANTPSTASNEPLVLYIARVPGSRDVFLTPMKPQEKVVTAEDVQSSLYYVHVSTDQDYQHLLNSTPARPSSVNTNASQLPTLTEMPKRVPPPLPKRREGPASPPYPVQNPPYPVGDSLPVIQAAPPSPVRTQQKLARKPVLARPGNTGGPRTKPQPDLPILPPRPLPTPPEEPPYEDTSLHMDNLRLLRRSSHLDEKDNPFHRDYSSHPETLKQQELDSRPEPGSLTLIRRSPGSGEQWNVASVYDPPVLEVSSSNFLVPTAKRRTKKGGTPLFLDITNPGYTQFASTKQMASESRTSISSTVSSDSASDPPPEGTFRRRLYMPGSRFAEHNYASSHRKHASVSAASGDSSIRQSMREDRHSVDMGSMPDRRSKAYSFTSPWNGACEFETAKTGRSLKCRHRIGNSIFDVSELRFNLPATSRNTPAPLTSNTSSYFLRHRQRSLDGGEDDFDTGSSIMITEDGRIDLSLGQEKAGGGFGGKQAKLGKLIIEPEGIKMLDLLVAANVGLWWRAWERA